MRPAVGRLEGVQGEPDAQRLVPLASKEFAPFRGQAPPQAVRNSLLAFL